MSGFKVELKGFTEAIRALDIQNLEQDITDELHAFGEDVARDAKQLVPVDEGFLKNSISSVQKTLGVEIVANADYAAYMEFGTRKFAAAYVATLPPSWQAFAAQYRGKGRGTFAELVAAITGWAKRTGKIPVEMAYVKALKILREGIPAQPFLYPAVQKNLPLLINRLKKLLNA